MTLTFSPGVVIDPSGLEIRVDGEPVPVEPQVYDVIAYLVDHRDRVVPKEELLDNIWGDRFVSESAVTSRIKSARRAVGDDGRTQSVIKTVHGRGYRWVAAELAAGGDPHAGDGPGGSTSGDHRTDGAPATPAPSPAGRGTAADAETGTRTEHAVDVDVEVEVERAQDGERPGGPERSDEWPLTGRTDELRRLAELFHDPLCGGVLLTGGAGMGKTRLARATLDLATRGGITTRAVAGHVELQAVPLGCLGSILPSEVTAITTGLDGELSRTVLVQRALDALDAGGGSRTMILVDDADLTDDLTRAVLTSAAAGDRLFLVLTQRTDERTNPVFDGLLRNGRLQRIDLGPVPAESLAVALYAALARPVEQRTQERLVTAAGGSPGMLRQLVEQSIHEGVLTVIGGVWTLDGELAPSSDLTALVDKRLGDLDDQQRRAVELLALAGELDLDVLVDLVPEESLDALDLRGLLAVTTGLGVTTVRLAHPMFGEVIRGDLPALRTRRLKAALADAVEAADVDRDAYRLRVTRWRLESDGELHPQHMLESAHLALLQKDFTTSRHLLDRLLADEPSSPAIQLHAELSFRQGRWDEVEETLAAIDLDSVDDDTRAQIIRRRAANMMWNRPNHRAPVELIEQHLDSVSGQARLSLESSWITMRVLVGSQREVIERAERAYADAEGTVKLELARAVALCRALVGRSQGTLEVVAEARELAASMPASALKPGTALLEFAEMKAFVDMGRMADAEELGTRLDRSSPELGWIPYSLAWLDIYRGRPRAAVDRLTPLVDVAVARGYDHNVAVMHNVLALGLLEVGEPDRAFDLALEASAFLNDRQEIVEIELLRGAANVFVVTGRLPEARQWILDATRTCVELGALPLAANLLIDAAHLGAVAEAAALAVELPLELEGALNRTWVEEVMAMAEGDRDALVAIADRYDRMGVAYYAAKTRAALIA